MRHESDVPNLRRFLGTATARVRLLWSHVSLAIGRSRWQQLATILCGASDLSGSDWKALRSCFCWQAIRRQDLDDQPRTHDFQHGTSTLMRCILVCFMMLAVHGVFDIVHRLPMSHACANVSKILLSPSQWCLLWSRSPSQAGPPLPLQRQSRDMLGLLILQ
jgi:hypothetical protein